MKKILVFQHVAFEILGTLNPLVKAEKFRIKYVNFGRRPDSEPTLKGYQGLVVLGGPMNAYQQDEYPHLKREIILLKQAIEKDIPVLGICLGAQLLSIALGGRVTQNPEKEIGWYDVSLTEEGTTDPLLRHIDGTEKIFQWHGDTFEIPEGASHLATTSTCPNQAFRYGKKVYGFQFHLEVDEPLIERWLTVPIHREELQSLKGNINAQTIRDESILYTENSKMLSTRVFKEFINLFGSINKYNIVKSR